MHAGEVDIDVQLVEQSGRTPLAEADPATRAALDSARGVIDSDAATVAWEQSSVTADERSFEMPSTSMTSPGAGRAESPCCRRR